MVLGSPEDTTGREMLSRWDDSLELMGDVVESQEACAPGLERQGWTMERCTR